MKEKHEEKSGIKNKLNSIERDAGKKLLLR